MKEFKDEFKENSIILDEAAVVWKNINTILMLRILIAILQNLFILC